MIAFEKNVPAILSYDQPQFRAFHNWYGLSFQLEGGYEGKKIDRTEFIEQYEPWFHHIISRMDMAMKSSDDLKSSDDSRWIVNHDSEGVRWFPNKEKNLMSLRKLFQEDNIPDNFTGALILEKDDLLRFSCDLITYPFTVFDGDRCLYNDLEISHSVLPFVIKVSAHRNIDLLSTDIELLKAIANEAAAAPFIVKPYRGTSL